jgi:hypothetical protein
VRLVDGEQRDRATVEQPDGGAGGEGLGSEIEQVELAGEEGRLDPAAGREILGGVEEAGPYPERPQGIDLVLHQGDERRDDHPDPVPDQRGDLVAQRLAAAGRHEYQRVAAADDLFDDVPLISPEGVIAEDPAQYPQRFVGPLIGGESHPGILGEPGVPGRMGGASSADRLW